MDKTPLEQDIALIGSNVLRMISLVRESTELARRALMDQDVEAGARCVAGDAQIDALQAELEGKILTVIARRQPAARDLRFLGASFQSLHDIERAGDYAEHVANAAIELAAEPPLKRYLDLQRCFEVVGSMLDATSKAYAEEDAEQARRAHAMDEEVDELYAQVQRELLTYMMESPSNIGRANRLLEVARYLERLGDHVENVNEHIVFWLTGERRM